MNALELEIQNKSLKNKFLIYFSKMQCRWNSLTISKVLAYNLSITDEKKFEGLFVHCVCPAEVRGYLMFSACSVKLSNI